MAKSINLVSHMYYGHDPYVLGIASYSGSLSGYGARSEAIEKHVADSPVTSYTVDMFED